MREYQFDPTPIRPRDQWTVGAMRAEAADVDISVRSLGRAVGGAADAVSLAAIAKLPED